MTDELPGVPREPGETPFPAMPRRLLLVPIAPEPPDPSLVAWLAASLGAGLCIPAGVEPLVRGEADWLTPERSQLRSGRVVDALLDRFPPPDEGDPERWVLGVTAADLSAGGRDFVFGEATLGGGWAVVSLARLGAAGEPAFRERLMKEALHELGHLAGLRHCERRKCLMHPARDVADVDARTTELCEICRDRGRAPERT